MAAKKKKVKKKTSRKKVGKKKVVTKKKTSKKRGKRTSSRSSKSKPVVSKVQDTSPILDYEHATLSSEDSTAHDLIGTSMEISCHAGKRGRKKGTPNEVTLRLMELIEEKYPNYHPVLAMAHMGNNRMLDAELRFRCHREGSLLSGSQTQSYRTRWRRRG